VSFDDIEDRTRRPVIPSTYESLEHLGQVALQSFQLDHWSGQPHYCELWCEKESLASLLVPVAQESQVTFLACKGYPSLSALHEASERFLAAGDREKHLLYLGDLDPRGLHMSTNIDRQLRRLGTDDVHVERLALNWGQVEQLGLPAQPTKITDSMAREFGSGKSYELDALEPTVLVELARQGLENYVDHEQLEKVLAFEQLERERWVRKLAS
jgi:hypothetical protein